MDGSTAGNYDYSQALVPVGDGTDAEVGGYYDEYGQWILYDDGQIVNNIPPGHVHDELGRLLKPSYELIDYETHPEDIDTYVSEWREQKLSASRDWGRTSKFVWPELDHVVMLKRLDLFEQQNPQLQQATTNIEVSRRVRRTPGWFPVRSIFFMDVSLPITYELLIESTGPPRRHKFRPQNRENARDFSKWVLQEKVNAYVGADRIDGACNFYVDYCDLPDRYFLSSEPDAPVGHRRLYRFAAYSATQFFILQKYEFSEELEAEGGYGMTYTIEPGPIVFARKAWKIIGSFYGFDHELKGSSKYTIYRRNDPFRRMMIARDNIQRPEEWDSSLSFYAFDVPVPGTMQYVLQHCVRSIHSALASIPRHRLTTEQPHNPWEFRMNIYVIPAALEDCSFSQVHPGSDQFSVGCGGASITSSAARWGFSLDG